MPIITTQNISKEIKSLLFVDDGSLNVVLNKFEDGVKVGEESYRIDAIDTIEILDITPIEGLTVRQQIIFSIYQYLLTNNLVKGTIAT